MRWFTGLGGERRPATRFAIAVLGVLAVVALLGATFRVSGTELGYPWLGLLAFLPYLGAVALVCLIAGALLRSPLVAALGLAAALLIGAAVAPRIRADEATGAGGPTVTVLALNVGIGNADAASVVGMIDDERPDVVALEELTPEEVSDLDRAGIARLLPARHLEPAPGSAGTGLLAVAPLESLPSVGPDPQARARTELGGRTIELTAVHPRAPQAGDELWSEGLESLPAEPDDASGILLGDFNASLDIPQFRDVVDRGYLDASEASGDGLVPTWPESNSHVPGIVIDHILPPEGSSISDYRTIVVPGTDHRAIVATITLPGD